MNILTKRVGSNQHSQKLYIFLKLHRYGNRLGIAFILLLLILSTIALTKELSTYDYSIQNPIRIEPRPTSMNRSLVKKAEAKELTLEEYICTFDWDCETALAVAKRESGMRCDAQHVNTNGTVDISIFQINSVHLKKGVKLTDLVDCRFNIDYAHQLYTEQGNFCAWVAYQKLTNECK